MVEHSISVEINYPENNYIKNKEKIEYGIVSTVPRFLKETNDLLEQMRAQDRKIIGLEVIDKTLQAKLDKNIDPQHTNNNKRIDASAIDYTFTNIVELIREIGNHDVLLVTSRADLDSVGATAVLKMALENKFDESKADKSKLDAIKDIVKKINAYDNYTAKSVWQRSASIEEAVGVNKEFGALNLAMLDFKVDLRKRVRLMEKWLETGADPQDYVLEGQQEIEQIITSIDNGETTIEYNKDKDIAVVYLNYLKHLISAMVKHLALLLATLNKIQIIAV